MLTKLPILRGLFAPKHLFSTKKIQIFINGRPYQVDNNLSIYQAAKENGIEIPRFCYHERLKIAGNCRMCMVEVEKAPKPITSCCAQVAPAMRINTTSQAARIARGGVMEFLLANHPLDCPICDQGGQCDLQNNSFYYGFNASRYHQFKRAVQDKNIGPIVVTHMNRCIHCTRCIRFAEEIGGFFELGMSGRGRLSQIGTYIERMLPSELSGNLADVCPVGALNHGPTQYQVRPYQLLRKDSIDIMDSLGCNTEIQYKENTVMRIQPRVNEHINEQWLSDKSRQAFDGLKRQRLLTPMYRKGENFVEYDWQTILSIIAQRVNAVDGKDIACGIGQFECIQSIQALKDYLNSLNCFNYEFRSHNNLELPINFRSDYLFNSQIEQIEDADTILLVGVNPRTEAPVLNARILKAVSKNKAKVYSIGSAADLTYSFEHLGSNANVLEDIESGSNKIGQKFKSAKLPMMIIGRDALTRPDSAAILAKAKSIANKFGFVNQQKGWNGFNVLHRSQGQVNALELGIKLKPMEGKPKILFLLGVDNNITPKDIPKDAFVVYIGSFGDQGVQYADVILPVAAYTEKSGTYVNTQGRVQIANKATNPPGHSREAWQVLRALSEQCGVTLPYNSLQDLRQRIYDIAPHLLKYNHVEPSVFGRIGNTAYGKTQSINNTPFADTIDNFYMTDAISRNSITMAKCSTAYNPYRFTNFGKIMQQL